MAMSSIPRHIILTGTPGVGKTTLLCKVYKALGAAGLEAQGFYTEELRLHGQRTGFDVVTLSGRRAPLARVKAADPSDRRVLRVGKYVVEQKSFELAALPTLTKRSGHGQKRLYVIDEIGKMELFSKQFIQAVKVLLEDPAATVFATIPVPKGQPLTFVEEIRQRSDVKVIAVTRENRNTLLTETVQLLKSALEMK